MWVMYGYHIEVVYVNSDLIDDLYVLTSDSFCYPHGLRSTCQCFHDGELLLFGFLESVVHVGAEG